MAARTAPFVRQPRGQPLRASLLQEPFWDAEKLLDGEPVFHLRNVATLRGRLDLDVLERAVTFLSTRHETLRTTFHLLEGQLHQVIAEPGPVALHVHDVAAGGLSAATSLAFDVARVPYDLSAAPPFRAHVYRFAEDEHLLSVEFHHVAVDMWSKGLLWNELWVAYNALRDGRDPPIPARPFDFADFAAWHSAEMPRLREELGFWRRLVGDGIPPLELPVDRPRSAATGYRGSRREFQISGEHSHALLELARNHGATGWMAYLAAFQAMLHRVTGQIDFGIGTPVSMLNRAQREGMAGPFLNLIMVRADLSGEPSFIDLLTRVRRSALDAVSHRDVPWAWIFELAPPSPAGVSPHFQAMFNFDVVHGTDVHVGGVEVTPYMTDIAAVEFDLGLDVYVSEGGAVGILEYKTSLFEPATVDRLIGEFVGVIGSVVADPRRPLG